MTIGVLVEVNNINVDKTFYYNVPSILEKDISIGKRVFVPFGKRKIEGFIIEIKNNNDFDFDLKDIISIVDETPILNEELLELGKLMKQKYLSSLISNYNIMLPKALKANYKVKQNKKYDTIYKLNNVDLSKYKFNDKQIEIIEYLKKNEFIVKSPISSFSLSSIQTLKKNNIIIEEKKEVYRLEYENVEKSVHKLTSDQQKVFEEVEVNLYNTYLLYGVTGSGKTEVYMELIDKVMKNGKSAIMLVPEISLTPQMINRFQARFGNMIASLHSGLSDLEKYDEYRRIAKHEVKIVIGARSAIFAPLSNIGIIIIDEEHTDSYKQDDKNPRYSAIDIAQIRAKTYNCPLILGSATPRLESMARAHKGVYKLLTLNARVNNKKLPQVKVVDMNKYFKTSIGHFSGVLINEIKNKLEKKNK